jgi:uncharacterized protein
MHTLRKGSRPGSARSASLFHRLEAPYHCFDARSDLLVLLQQSCAFCRQRILPLFKRAIFILQLVTHQHQRVDSLFQSLEFVFKHDICIFGHGSNIEPGKSRINCLEKPAWPAARFRGIIWPPNHTISMQETIEYSDLDNALRRCGASWNAAQAHGLLCGRLCLPSGDSLRETVREWVATVQDGGEAGSTSRADCAALLERASTTTLRQFAERQSQFVPLLPEDAGTVELRTEALSHWCEGFLHGLVSGNPAPAVRSRLAAQPLADIIRDFLEMTRAAVDEQADEETNEEAYVELVEYIRVAAQLAYEELAEFRPAGSEFAADVLHSRQQ